VKVKAALASGVAYAAIAAIMGREVLASLGTTIASDPGDPVLNAAILAWNAKQVPWTDAWFQFPIFYPTPNALTFSEHLLGVSPIATPVYWLTGNALAAYNIALLASYPLCGLAMYALVWRLTSCSGAAFLAGLAFAFAPYRASQLPHIQVLTTFWAPLALLGLHGFLDAVRLKQDPTHGVRSVRLQAHPRWLWLALFAVCWLLQGAANGYFLVFFSVVVALWVVWFLLVRGPWRDAAVVGIAMTAAALPLIPILYRYVTAHRDLGLSRNLGEITSYSADIAAPLCAPALLTFWGWLRVTCAQEGELFAGAGLIALCCLGGWAAARAANGERTSAEPREMRERPVMLADRRGVTIARRLALTVAAVYVAIAATVLVTGPWRIDLGSVRASASAPDKPLSVALAMLLLALLLARPFHRWVRHGSTATFYLAVAAVCWVMSWGPFPRLFGVDVLYQAPFAWLLQLPGVGGLRVPARFWMMAVLCLIVFMGLTLAKLLARCGPRTRASAIAVAACALLADGWLTIPAAAVSGTPPVADALRGRTVLTLPAGPVVGDVAAVYHAVVGEWTSINGYSGYEPRYYEALRTLVRDGDDVLLDAFAGRREVDVLVDEGDAAMRSLIEQQPGAELVAADSRERVAAKTPAIVRYRVPQRTIVPRITRPPGERLTVHGLTASCSPETVDEANDGDLDSRWVCGLQTASQEIRVDLHRLMRVGAIVHALGTLAENFPRQLLIETSADGQTWDRAWEGSSAAAVFFAAMDEPRTTRVVLRFAPRPARYVRLRQIGRDERNYWSIAELEVWSGAR
jgi:hypothetical protein